MGDVNYNLLAHIPDTFTTNLESKKWTERRDALQELLTLLENNPKLDPKAQYSELVDKLKNIVEKDANINVAAIAVSCLKGMASGLQTKFAPYALTVTPVVLEKFKEKKPVLRSPLTECIDVIFTTTTLDQLLDDIVNAMGKPNPQIKSQTDKFLSRAFKNYGSATVPKKTLKNIMPLLIKHTSDPDAEVREAAYESVGSVMRATGEKAILPLISDISEDKMKMDKIKEHYQKILEEVGADGLLSQKSIKPVENEANGQSTENEAQQAATAAPAAEEPDPFDLLDPVDVLSKLPETFHEHVVSKKWTERRDAYQALLGLLEKNPKLDPKVQYGEIVNILKTTIQQDSNINVCAIAAKCLGGIAAGLRKAFGPHALTVTSVILEKFKEKKATLREPLVACFDSVYASTSLEAIQEDVVGAMEKPNPQVKAQTDLFLHRAFLKFNSATMPKKSLKVLAPLLVKHTGESDPEVRDASYSALAAAMWAISEKAILPLLADISGDKTKMGKIKESYQEIVNKIGPEVAPMATQKAEPAPDSLPPKPPGKPPARPAPKKAPLSRAGSQQSINGTDEEAQKPAAPNKKPEKKTPPKDDEEEAQPEPPKNSELLAVNDGKLQRIKDEKQMKLLKWNFSTPTDEHISQLNQQLGAVAKVSLTQLLFSKDFKQHMKAIELLRSSADTSAESIVKNSDLLLKWCTLRFFETNPAVLIQVLELCKLIVESLQNFEDPLTNEEVASFVPYFLLKVGEPKDNMRKVIKEIVDVITSLCGPLKMTPYLIEALKTKNSRQKAECLIILEDYITKGGVAALKSTGIHKAIAACLPDRDTGVRNAAINGLVACYREEGDQMWKNVGKLADKDRSYVEERIKRTGAAPGSSRPQVTSTPLRAGGAKVVVPPSGIRQVLQLKKHSAGGTVVRRNRSRSRLPEVEDPEDAEQDGDYEPAVDSARGMRQSNSRYQIDEDFVELAGVHALPSTQLIQDAESYVPRIPSAPIRPTPSTPLKRTGSSSSISSLDTFDQLEKVIHNVSSGIADVATEAIEQITFMIKSEDQKLMIEDRISITMKAIATQLNLVRKIHGVHSSKGNPLLKLMLNFLLGLTAVPKRINMDDESMSDWLYAIIPILPALDGEYEEQLKKSFNVTIIRVSQRVEVTVFFVACARSLQSILKEDPSSPCVELFVKCLYKWQDIVKKQPQPLRLNVFLTAANEFYHNLGQDELYMEHIKIMELCLQHAILIMGDAVQDGIRRLPNPNHKLVSYCNVFLQQMYNTDSNWTPKLPGAVAEELPQPKSVRSESVMRREVHILVDNVVRDLNSLEAHVAKLIDLIHKSPEEAEEYEKYIEKCCMGSTVRKIVENFKKNRRLLPISDQMYVNMAQTAITQRAKLEKILKGDIENGNFPNNVLHSRDINTESFTSELPMPANLVSLARPPVEETKIRKVRRSIDPAVYSAIQNKLAGISDA